MSSPSAILSSIHNSLPSSEKSLGNPQDAVAALLHSVLSKSEFKLIATDEECAPSDYPDNALPEGWNAHGPSIYTLRYVHIESKITILLRLSRLGTHFIVNAVAVESDRTAYMDIPINDLVSSSASFPVHLDNENASTLNSTFANLDEFVVQFKLAVTEKLIPPQLSGSKLLDTAELRVSSQRPPRPSRDINEPPRPDPTPGAARPQVPDEDYLPRNIGQGATPRNPLEVGRSDLDPFGGRGRNPFEPPSLFSPAGGDGMFVGPEHPMFGGAFSPRGGLGGNPNLGPFGGDGYLPPSAVPPGARFDPVMPGDPLGGPRGPNPLGGRGPARRGGEPDNDEFMPPGARDMFM